MLDRTAIKTIVDTGIAQYPKEACGLILNVGKKTFAVACDNVSDDPKNRFKISPTDYAKFARKGDVVAIWHTHTDEPATASLADVEMCKRTNLPWFIVAISKDADEIKVSEPTVIYPKGEDIPYLERPYVFGIHDCYTLIIDFYKREFGIEMGNQYPRIENWWSKGYDFFSENFKEQGFVQVIDEEPQYGDIFIIQSESKVPNHVAIYIGNETILHHCHGRLSSQDIYGGYWYKHTAYHVRHKSKC